MTTNTPEPAFYVPNRTHAPNDYRLMHYGCTSDTPFTNPAGYCAGCGDFVGVVHIVDTLPGDLLVGDVVAGSLLDIVVEAVVMHDRCAAMTWRRLGEPVGHDVHTVELAKAQTVRVVVVAETTVLDSPVGLTLDESIAWRKAVRAGFAWPHGLD